MQLSWRHLLAAAAIGLVPPGLAAAQDTGAGNHGHVLPQGQAVDEGHAGAAASAGGAGELGGLRRSISFQIGQRNVKSILMDGRYVWIGSSGGAIQYDTHRGSYLTYDNKQGLLSNGVFHLSKVNGEIWVGTYGGGLSVLNPDSGKWRNYNIPNGMGDAFVYGTLAMPNGDVWIATWSGANRIRGGDLDDISKWDLYTVENTGGGLPNDWVYGLAAGKNGEVWLATEGGLARFENEQWTNWTHADGLGAPLELVEQDASGTDPGSLSSHHARQKEEQGLGDVKVAYNPNYIVSLSVGADGDVWAGTWGAGLSRFDGEHWHIYTVADGLPSNHVYALHTDAEGRLWIGTGKGLAVLTEDGIRAFGRELELAVQSVFAIATSGKAAWVGGFGGVTWYPNGVEGTLGEGHGASMTGGN